MADRDRTGERIPDRVCPDPQCTCPDPRCVPGANRTGHRWIGLDDEARPIPCLNCKSHLARTRSDVHDYAEREPSARARAAIERENQP